MCIYKIKHIIQAILPILCLLHIDTQMVSIQSKLLTASSSTSWSMSRRNSLDGSQPGEASVWWLERPKASTSLDATSQNTIFKKGTKVNCTCADSTYHSVYVIYHNYALIFAGFYLREFHENWPSQKYILTNIPLIILNIYNQAVSNYFLTSCRCDKCHHRRSPETGLVIYSPNSRLFAFRNLGMLHKSPALGDYAPSLAF